MQHIVEILSVGTELLLGNIANLDAQIISRGLGELGLNVYHHTVVGDNPERLAQAVEVAKSRADIIITTGGLGPTCDDLTKTVLAKSFGKEMYFDEDCAREIEEYFQRLGKKGEMTENNLQQALLPEGCTVLTNPWGTAPGCAFFADGCHVVMLPGPPFECRKMFFHRAKQYLQKLSEGAIVSHTLKMFGIGESSMEFQLRERMNTSQNPTLAPYAKEGECELRITAKGATEAEAEKLLAPVVEEMSEKFSSYVYGIDVENLESVALDLLEKSGKTLCTAESCTGGLVAKRLTDIVGSSKSYIGGVVAYSNQLKQKLLGVPTLLLEEFGAVSAEVAVAMAEGARSRLGGDIAVATTGLAGPDGDGSETSVGTIFVAIATEEKTQVRKLALDSRRGRNRSITAHNAYSMIIEQCKK